MKKILLVFNFILLAVTGYSQGQFTIIDSLKGLPENDLTAVTADKNGTLWIGTSKSGIVSYSGKAFKIYTNKTAPIGKKSIAPIFADTTDTLWMPVDDNSVIVKFDGKKWSKLSDNLLKDFGVTAIVKDNSSNLYVGGTKGLLKFNGKEWSKVNLPSQIIVRALDINKEGVLAIGHSDGLMVGTEGNWKEYTSKNSELSLDVVRAVKFTPENQLIIGYGGGAGKGGFSVMNGDKWTHFNKQNSTIPDHMVRDIERDSNGAYWLATNYGVVKYKDGAIQSYFPRKGKYRNVILDIAVANNSVWLATNFGLVKLEE